MVLKIADMLPALWSFPESVLNLKRIQILEAGKIWRSCRGISVVANR